MSRARKQQSPTLPARGSAPSVRPEGHHTCTRCPACATDTCKVLQDLGMYCDTACAASLATAAARGPKHDPAAA